jgi:hypothetical protein
MSLYSFVSQAGLVWEPSQVSKNLYALRRGGFAPALSDEEVLTRELCGAYFQLATATDLLGDLRPPYAPFFPRLSDRTRFVRPAAHLWQVKAALQQRLTPVSGHAAARGQRSATVPLPGLGLSPQGP